MHKLFFRTFFVTALLFLSGSSSLLAQTSTFEKGKRYMIDSIEVVGLKTYNAKTVISYSGLQKGQTIQVPGEDISKVINKLWKLEFFSDINFYVTRVDGDKIDLQLEIKELPTLSDVKIEGLRKSKAETIIKETELTSGKKLSESFLTNTKNYIVNKYKKNGYLNTKVTLNTIPDDTVPGTNNLKMVVKVDRGSPVKIKDIDFEGNEVFGAAKLRMKLKKTKKRFPLRFWKKSKFIAKEYEDDKKNLIDFYKEKGYRDARIITDSIISIEDKSMAIQLKIQEGNRYYFGDISCSGRSLQWSAFKRTHSG